MKSGTKIKFMTRIVLEISQEKDVALLLALLDRLNIQVVQKKSDIDKPGAALQEEQFFLLKGLPARKDIETLVKEIESMRKDRTLPERE